MLKCAHQWYLQRGLGLPQRPGWATVGGSAVHAATEELDKEGLDPDNYRDIFNAHFDLCIAEEVRRYDGEYPPDTWRASGRASKDWPNKEDERWWRANGPVFVGNWMNFRRQTSLELYRMDDGSEAIELEAEVEFGGLPCKVIIDRLFVGRHGLSLVDIKSGSTLPKDDLQLAIYSHALRTTYGYEVRWGSYFDARKAMLTPSYDLSVEKWPKDRIDFIFKSVRSMQEQGLFLANPSNMCSACTVKDYCLTMGGSQAHTVPQPWSPTDNV